MNASETPFFRHVPFLRGTIGFPSHRFVTSLAERQNMLDQGWVAEGAGIGAGMCVPQ